MRHWGKEEIEYLEEKWGYVSIPSIASGLNRTINSIKIKSGKLQLGRHLHGSDLISFNQLFIAITGHSGHGFDYEKLKKAGFPFIMKKSYKIRYRMVNINDFWEWLKKNPTQISIVKLPPGELGAEPDWVKYKRSADAYNDNLKTKGNIVWTRNEDERLKLYLLQFRYSYKDISKMLLRTENAIRRRIVTLGLKQRPVRAENRIWTEDENKMLIDMHGKGYGNEHIGSILNRTGNSIRGKVDILKHPERSLRSYRDKKREDK